MSKNVIVTIMTGFDPSYRFALNSFREYARKIGADLKVIKSPQVTLKGLSRFNFSKMAWAQKFLLRNYLGQYERVLYVDADIIIHPEAPNVFEYYSDLSKVFMFNEGALEDRSKEYVQIQNILGTFQVDELEEQQIYFNAGVILFSRESDFLKLSDMSEVEKVCNNINFYEQTYFNYLIFKNKLGYGFLEDKFNRMIISGSAIERLNSSFIHHAGGSYSSRSKFRFLTIISDYCYLTSYQLTIRDYAYIGINALLFYIRRYLKKIFA